MMFLTKWIGATLALALMANTAFGADTIATGKVKSVNAESKTFVLTDSADKDHTFMLGDNVLVNRAGKESKNGLKAGDAINVCYEKGNQASTAHYILVQEGTSKNTELLHGSIKSYDAAKKELTVTNEGRRDTTYPTGSATVRRNMEEAQMDSIRSGDQVLLVVDVADGRSTLHRVMIERVK